MNLGNLKTLARLYMPGAKTTIVNNTKLELILNLGAVDVAQRTVCLKKNKKFNITAEVGEYKISDIVDDFLVLDKSGIYWYDGTRWDEMLIKSYDWLDNNIPNWRDFDSGTPQYAYVEGDILGFHPKPSTTATQAGWVYYGRKPELMTAGADFPFHQENVKTVEMPHLSILSDSVLDYWAWQATKVLSKDDMIAQKAQQNRYLQNVVDRWREVRKNLAISYDKRTRLQGRKVRRRF